MADLRAFWRRFDPDAPAYVHPDDVPVLRRHLSGFAEAMAGGTHRVETRAGAVCFDLLPQPYVGDLAAADLVALFLNPGLSEEDHAVEARPEIRTALVRTLCQRRRGERLNLFFDPDPALTGHPGRRWAAATFKGIAPPAVLARRVAWLDLFPYHSRGFDRGRLARLLPVLPSARVARRFVHETLVPRARRGEITLVVARASRDWGFGETDAERCDAGDLVVYPRALNQGGYITPNTPGGRAMMRRLDGRGAA